MQRVHILPGSNTGCEPRTLLGLREHSLLSFALPLNVTYPFSFGQQTSAMAENFTIAKRTGSENYVSLFVDLEIVLRHHRHWSWIEGANERPLPRFITSMKTQSSTATTSASRSSPSGTIGTSTQAENPHYVTWEDGQVMRCTVS